MKNGKGKSNGHSSICECDECYSLAKQIVESIQVEAASEIAEPQYTMDDVFKKINLTDGGIITDIARRAYGLLQEAGAPRDMMSIEMDLMVVHALCGALDLKGLLDARQEEFMHDISGIAQHLNRITFAMMDCFVPRYTKQAVKPLKLSGNMLTIPTKGEQAEELEELLKTLERLDNELADTDPATVEYANLADEIRIVRYEIEAVKL